jgi:hypothetical protein
MMTDGGDDDMLDDDDEEEDEEEGRVEMGRSNDEVRLLAHSSVFPGMLTRSKRTKSW